jgi:16S rRNA (cytidine1402-2'-O)-methyltransferase
VRGEVTIVVAGAGPGAGAPAVATDAGSLRDAVAGLEAEGDSRRDAIRTVAARAGLPKRTVYDAVHAVGQHQRGGA